MEAIFLKLLNMSITAGWIVLIILALRMLLRKAPKGLVSLLWILVAVRLICPFSLESVWSLIPSAETVPENIGLMQEPAIHSGVPIINHVVNPVLHESFAPEPLNSVNPLQVVTWVASHIWVIGVAVMVLYVAISYWRIYRRVRASLPMERGVRVCDEIGAPFILGVIRPVIYLPSSLSEKDLEYVLAHERAHLKRKDHFWKPLAFALLTVYWFHPLLWVAYLFFSRDIEMACDERVIRKMDAEEKKEYTRTLLACSVAGNSLPACPLAFGEVGVKGRVKSMKRYKKPSVILAVVALVALMLCGIFFLTDPKDEENPEDTEVSTEQGEEYAEDISTEKVTPVEFDYEIAYLGEGSFSELYGGTGYSRPGLSSVRYFPVHEIDSDSELKAFQEMISDPNALTKENGHFKSYIKTAKKYDETFFMDHTLAIVYCNTGLGLYCGVDSVVSTQVDGENYLGIYVSQMETATRQPMSQGWSWLLFVELEKDDVKADATVYATDTPVDEASRTYYSYESLGVTYEVAYVGYTENAGSFSIPDFSSEVKYLPAITMKDHLMLDEYMLKYFEVDGFLLDQSYDEVPSLREAVEEYDEAFFKEHYLEMIYVPATSGSYRYEVAGLIRENKNGNPLRMYVQVEQSDRLEVGTMDMAGWMLMVPVRKDQISPYGWIFAVQNESNLEQLLWKQWNEK